MRKKIILVTRSSIATMIFMVRSRCFNIDKQIYRNIYLSFNRQIEETSDDSKVKINDNNEVNNDEISIDDIVEPTNCCMSGCANCVWIQYAENLSRVMNRSDADLQKLIMEKIQDPNMKAFLGMELKCRNLIK